MPVSVTVALLLVALVALGAPRLQQPRNGQEFALTVLSWEEERGCGCHGLGNSFMRFYEN